jgi:hypothetical protein
LSARVPHGIKSRIINLYQRAGSDIFPQIQAQRFENLQPPGALMLGLRYGVRLHLGVIGFLESRVGRFRKRVEAARIRSVILTDGIYQTVFEPSGQVHHGADILAVHHCQKFLRCTQIVALTREFDALFRFLGKGNMGMNINDGIPRALDARFAYLQHALGLVVGESQRHVAGGF